MIFVEALRFISEVVGIIVCSCGGIFLAGCVVWWLLGHIYECCCTAKVFVDYARNRKAFLEWKVQRDAQGGAK